MVILVGVINRDGGGHHVPHTNPPFQPNPTQPIKSYQQHYRALPALVTSTFVQCINMPIIRATITLQNPA